MEFVKLDLIPHPNILNVDCERDIYCFKYSSITNKPLVRLLLIYIKFITLRITVKDLLLVFYVLKFNTIKNTKRINISELPF